jgi:hypothetical protein
MDHGEINECLRGLPAAFITVRRSSKNKKPKAARACQEDGMPRLFRSRQLIPQRGLSTKPGRQRHTLRYEAWH